MERRSFLLTSGSAVLTASGLSLGSRSAVGLEFELSSVPNQDPSSIDSLSVDFESFKLIPRYLDDSKDLSVRITLEMEGIGSEEVSLDVPVKMINRSDIASNLPVLMDGINTSQKYIDAHIKITIEHSDLGEETYNKSFTIHNNAQMSISGDKVQGSEITFTGSSDLQSVVSYEWDLDGDGDYEKSGTSVTHTYSSSGLYNVGLKVTGSDGLEYMEQKPIEISGKLYQSDFSSGFSTFQKTGGGGYANADSSGLTVVATPNDGSTDYRSDQFTGISRIDFEMNVLTGYKGHSVITLFAEDGDSFTISRYLPYYNSIPKTSLNGDKSSWNTSTFSKGTEYQMRIEISESSITGYRDGVQIFDRQTEDDWSQKSLSFDVSSHGWTSDTFKTRVDEIVMID